MICYICQINVPNWKALVTHFKILHLLKSNSIYRCSEGNCTKAFQCLESFKRHIITSHKPKCVPVVSFNSNMSNVELACSLSLDIIGTYYFLNYFFFISKYVIIIYSLTNGFNFQQ